MNRSMTIATLSASRYSRMRCFIEARYATSRSLYLLLTADCLRVVFFVLLVSKLTDTVPTTDTVWNGNADQLKMPNETTIQTLLQLDNTI